MPYINDTYLDLAVAGIATGTRNLYICSTEPTTYAQATTTYNGSPDRYSLGSSASITMGAAANGSVSGRRTIVSAISNGSVTASATAGFWAITDASAVLIATGALSAPQAVTLGNTFSLGSFSIEFPDAV